ncbi:MAG: ABC-type molybdenum transport system, ATPase component/photorepair protein PhrA [Frankiales bacterium]|nr:ABC-type molybdenum transport system, ATPase component/photorepair protein PhrA [Frankiales bacterium]
MIPAAVLSHVGFRRDETQILRGIDLTVGAGERWALLGPNGCGKTTVLSLLGALQHPSSGTVDVLGHRLGRVDIFSVLWPQIGHVQGRHRPSGRPTVEQIVLTGLTGTNSLPLRWEPTPEQVAAAREALSSLGIGPLAPRNWTHLSNGERRRVLIARALVKEPALLLLDEPAAGLDLPAREHLVDALEDLALRRPELSSVLVSHHVEELPATTTHAALMKDGVLLASGPAADVLTSSLLSDCFDLDLQVTYADGRWSARRVRQKPGKT